MIAGFEQPTEGVIRLNGADIHNLPPHRRNVNMVFQNYALFPHLSVYDNVAFGLQVKRVASTEIRQRVGEALEMVRLPGMERRKPSQLSGGQQQRVALARALVNRPAVLLLDEPLGALDQKLRKDMQLELKRLQREVSITFIYVTHDQEEALTMSDRIAVMHQGQALQISDPRTIYERPATRYVADFIGTTNFLDATVSALKGAEATTDVDGIGEMRAPLISGLGPKQAVTLAIRPEKIRVEKKGKPSGKENAAKGNVEEIVFIGNDTQVFVRLANGALMMVREQNRNPEEHVAGLVAGDDVTVIWPIAATNLLTS
jgi:spermidine/putrescine transport system ATP-binding protein